MEIKLLPYIKGVPDDGQKRISFVKNGCLLTGSETKFGWEGVLNTHVSQVQDNIVFVYDIVKDLNVTSDLNSKEIAEIKEYISQSGSLELIEKVKENTDNIEFLKAETEALDVKSETNLNSINAIKLQLGTKPAGVTKTIYEDLTFVKIQIGNEANVDINGNPSIGTVESGLVKKTNDTIKQVLINKADIADLKDKIEIVDLPTIESDVAKLRSELGPVSIVGEKTVKVRLTDLEETDKTVALDISGIKTSIGYGSIVVVDELATIKSNHTALKDVVENSSTGLVPRVAKIETTLGDSTSGIVKEVADNKTKISSLESHFNDPTTGVDVKIDKLNKYVGIADPASVDQTTLTGKVNVLTALNNDNTAILQDLQVEVGNGSSGLIYEVAQLKLKVSNLESKNTDLENRIIALENK